MNGKIQNKNDGTNLYYLNVREETTKLSTKTDAFRSCEKVHRTFLV